MDGKEKRKAEKEKKKGKGGRVQMGKRMPAGKKAVTHSSSSDSSDEEEGEEGKGDYQVNRYNVLYVSVHMLMYMCNYTPLVPVCACADVHVCVCDYTLHESVFTLPLSGCASVHLQ